MPAQGLSASPRARRAPRALVHVGAGIGNVVLATPLLVALERLGYRVDLWLSADYPDTGALLRGWSAIGEIHLRREDLDLDLYDALIPAIPPFYWRRFARHFASRAGVVERPPDAAFYADEQDFYLHFARALGWPAGEAPACRLPIAPAESSPVSSRTVAILPGCKSGEMRAKRWPHYPELASRFADVAVLGTPEDLHAPDGTPLVFEPHVKMLAGQLSLEDTASALAGAGIAVGNDSGLSHVAAAAGTPTLMLFGPTPSHTLGALPSNVTTLRAGLACEPCWFAERLGACGGAVDCLRAIPVDAVAAAVTRVIG